MLSPFYTAFFFFATTHQSFWDNLGIFLEIFLVFLSSRILTKFFLHNCFPTLLSRANLFPPGACCSIPSHLPIPRLRYVQQDEEEQRFALEEEALEAHGRKEVDHVFISCGGIKTRVPNIVNNVSVQFPPKLFLNFWFYPLKTRQFYFPGTFVIFSGPIFPWMWSTDTKNSFFPPLGPKYNQNFICFEICFLCLFSILFLEERKIKVLYQIKRLNYLINFEYLETWGRREMI